MKWRKRAVGGWITDDGRWVIRGPIFGKKLYWVYLYGVRYSPTGGYDKSVSFDSLETAKRYVMEVSQC